MALTATSLLQALSDAGITDQAQATRLFRILLQQALRIRQNTLTSKVMSGTPLTGAEQTELASNEVSLATLASQLL